mmetsp:Transcript_114304/g.179921  ORF Transcript_114304/g.179921 Transcript_114304/m.179921 type:complete len:251 (+) Transcript_114304:112-864(+)
MGKQPGDDALATRHIKIHQQSTVRTAPKWTFGSGFSTNGPGDGKTMKRASSCPSPGQYGCPSVEQKYQSLPKWGFGTGEQRMGQSKKYDKLGPVPGPGAYTPVDPNTTSASFGFGTASRLPKTRPTAGPPPGTYDFKTTLSDKHVSIASRTAGGKAFSAPGPGAYGNPDRVCKSAPSYGIGSGNRSDILGVSNSKFPGPGNYDTHKIITLGSNPTGRGSPSFCFKSRRRPVKCDSTPGPIFAPYSQFDQN